MAANPQSPEGYLAQLRSIETHDTRGRLGAVTCPAMTLVGEEDILIYPKLSRRLHDELPTRRGSRCPEATRASGSSRTSSTRRCWTSSPAHAAEAPAQHVVCL